ncbi:hypothetical protein FQN57_006793 [Myotisia sp. PD_48]|nr:hypothetical protein FQN57_006793 [Myotisia sp. PD_48]
MEVSELPDDLRDLYERRDHTNIPDNFTSFKCPKTKTSWKAGPIFSERVIEAEDEVFDYYVAQACGVCIVTQVEGPNPGLQAIAKLQCSMIPDDPYDPSTTKPKPHSGRASLELVALEGLVAAGSTHTPKLLAEACLTQGPNHPVPGGFISVLVMEKVPGHNLNKFFDLPLEERDEVRIAFSKAFRDPGRRNLVWDRENKKIYIIDLENAYRINSKADPVAFVPERHFFNWEIAGPEIMTSRYGIDPMVPNSGEFVRNPDQAWIEKLAADAKGITELKFGRRMKKKSRKSKFRFGNSYSCHSQL